MMQRLQVRAAIYPALMLIAALAGCGRDEPGEIPPSDEIPRVDVVRPTATGSTVSFPATVHAVERAELATRISGTVLRVPVDVGSAVGRGDVVLVLDDADVAARIRQAEAQFERARRALARIEPLNEDGAATDQELDDAQAAFRVAEASLAEARAQRAYTVLRAPFTGVVTARSVDPGDLALPGRPVLTMVGMGGLEVTADLPASREGRIAVGDTLVLMSPETGMRIPVSVERVAPALESATRRFRVEASLPAAAEHGLVSGAYVRLEVDDAERRTLWVPEATIVRRGQMTGVFTVESDTARLRWIRSGARHEDAVEVLAGLSAEDAVVLDPPADLEDGAAVRMAGGSAP
ncbi:MAG: efflux RND transporter periplasmic adaptor subunit [Gemmatimonadota bacterium]